MMPLSKMGAFTLLAISCLTIMVGCVIVPGLPVIAQNLVSGESAGLLVTIPALGVVVLGPLAGMLIHRTGLYKALALGLFFYGALGAGGCLLQGAAWVWADRLLLGGATALVMAGGTGLIAAFYQGQARLRMIARQGMAIELGGVVFLFVGGLLAMLGWRWPFTLYLVAWILLGLLLIFVPNPRDTNAVERDLSLNQPLTGELKRIFVTAILSMLAFFSAVIVLPTHLQTLSLNEAEVGYFLSFVSLVAVAAAGAMPLINGKLSERTTLTAAFCSYALAHCLFAVAHGLPMMILGGVFMGVGFGLSVPLVNHMTLEKSPPPLRGRNLAYLSMAIFSGQFLCSVIEMAPTEPFWIFAGCSAMAAASALWMYEREKDRHVRELGDSGR